MRIESQPNQSLVAQLTLAQAGPSGVTFQQTLTNSSGFVPPNLPSTNATQNPAGNSATQVAAKQEKALLLPTQPASIATASPATPNPKQTIAQAQDTLSPHQTVGNQDQASSATAISSVAKNAATQAPLETPAEQEPAATPVAPVESNADESAPAVNAQSVNGVPAPVLVAQFAETDSAAPIGPPPTVAPAPTATVSQSTRSEAPVETGDAVGSTATASTGAAIGGASNVLSAVSVAYGNSSNGPGSGDLQPVIAQATTVLKPAATIAASQAAPVRAVAQASDVKANTAGVDLDPTMPASPQSGISSHSSDSRNTAVPANATSNVAQTVNPTELWVGMHSSFLRSNVWSPAAFTSTGTATESAANTSTPAQLLAVQTTLTGTASLGNATKSLAQPAAATSSAGSKAASASVKADRTNAKQQSAPASVSSYTVSSAALSIPLPVQAIAPVESIVSSPAKSVVSGSNDGSTANEATTVTWAEASTASLPSQTQAGPGTLPAPQAVANSVPTPNTAMTSNGASNENYAVAANGAGFSLQALGFTPQMAGEQFNLPSGIVPANVPANASVSSQPAASQAPTDSDSASAANVPLPAAPSASVSAPAETLPVAGEGSSTLSLESSQPVQDAFSNRPDDIPKNFAPVAPAQSVTTTNASQAPQPDASLDGTTESQSDTASTQTQTAPAQTDSDVSPTVVASPEPPPNGGSPNGPQPDAPSNSSANSNAIAGASNTSAKPIDAMSETELWVGMHSGDFASNRDAGQSPLPGPVFTVPASLQDTLADLSMPYANGFDLPASANATARPSLREGDSKLTGDERAATSVPIPVSDTTAAPNNSRRSDAGAPATSGTAANTSGFLGAQGTSHPAQKPQAAEAPTSTNAVTKTSGTADATNPQAALNSPDATPLQTVAPTPQSMGEIVNLPVALPATTDPVNGGGPNQSARKDAAKETASANTSKASSSIDTADASSARAAQSGAGANAGSSLGSQNGGQSPQHSAPDSSQTAAVISKSPDGSAAMPQTVPAHLASHGATAAAGSTDSSKAAASPTDRSYDAATGTADAEDSVTRSSLNTSKLMQTMSESEMRVGMHSSEFGNISIRTTVSPQQMLAQISLDHSDLGQAISAHAATVQTKLGNDSGLRTTIEVNQQTASSSGNSGGSPQREQQAFVRSVRADSTALPVEADLTVGPAAQVNASSGYRLDIRA